VFQIRVSLLNRARFSTRRRSRIYFTTTSLTSPIPASVITNTRCHTFIATISLIMHGRERSKSRAPRLEFGCPLFSLDWAPRVLVRRARWIIIKPSKEKRTKPHFYVNLFGREQGGSSALKHGVIYDRVCDTRQIIMMTNYVLLCVFCVCVAAFTGLRPKTPLGC